MTKVSLADASLDLLITLKGALDNIFQFSFWLNFIYQIQIDCLFTPTKRKIQKFLQKVKTHQFLLSMHKVGMRLICTHDSV